MAEYQAGRGTTALGIIGTSLGGLAVANQGVLGNLLGGILGGGAQHNTGGDAALALAMGMAAAANSAPRCGCNEDHLVDRYTLQQEQTISELKSQIALRDANTFSDQKQLEMYKYVDGRFTALEGELAKQAVRNQRTEDSFVVAANELAAVKKELEGKIKMEAERRCCGDNAIVNYVNATFYPKLTASITTGTETTAATTYNPLPDCSCGC